MTVSCFNSFVHFAQCGNYGNLLSRFFDKNFVKTTHLVDSLNKPLKSWLDGKKFWWEQIFHFPTVCFVVAKEVTKELISRNFFNVIVFCSTFPPFGNNCFAFTKVFSKKCEKFTAPVFRNISVKSTFYLERPAPGLRPGYPGPIHGPGPGSEGVRVRVQKKPKKCVIWSQNCSNFQVFSLISLTRPTFITFFYKIKWFERLQSRKYNCTGIS